MSLLLKKHSGVKCISGPLIIVKYVPELCYGAIVEITDGLNNIRHGQVLEVSEEHAVIQVFEHTLGLDVEKTSVNLLENEATLGVTKDLIGRVLNGCGKPIDGAGEIIPDLYLPIIGQAINPVSREIPRDFIQTGITSIDGFNTLVRGQKLPIFSGAGLPADEIAAQIIKQAKVLEKDTHFLIVFAGMGITQREANFFMNYFEESGSFNKVITLLNLASDPTIERILTPRYALTIAEYLAFHLNYHILVILTDMTNYCQALREIGSAREEIPGRRGYPGYMYTDLATIYERAGKIKGKEGSITLIPILTMPDDDITHPIADLTGYITEGQIVLSRKFYRSGIYPPIDILPSLSRLMNNGIGTDKTREDHRQLANQLYACYAEGCDIRKLVAIVGEEALNESDRKYLKFAKDFEEKMLSQGNVNRDIEETLNLGWELLSIFKKSELIRMNKDLLNRYLTETMEDGVKSPFL
ncbi:V-type ATP synthase subunit B [bacterium]|nr:V-type ATP synthase subunit B [bacterium]MBU1153383.1 V-type ATP synthase subunit B [bacterium]